VTVSPDERDAALESLASFESERSLADIRIGDWSRPLCFIGYVRRVTPEWFLVTVVNDDWLLDGLLLIRIDSLLSIELHDFDTVVRPYLLPLDEVDLVLDGAFWGAARALLQGRVGLVHPRDSEICWLGTDVQPGNTWAMNFVTSKGLEDGQHEVADGDVVAVQAGSCYQDFLEFVVLGSRPLV
jgi:hypothetical protein